MPQHNAQNATVLIGSRRSETSKRVPRISRVQKDAMIRAIGGREFESTEIAQIANYVASGDLSELSSDLHKTITALCKTAKTTLNESQAKRIWPRKMASVIITTGL